jgi:hypothetical protein
MNSLELVLVLYKKLNNWTLSHEEAIHMLTIDYPDVLASCFTDIPTTLPIMKYRWQYNYIHLDMWMSNQTIEDLLRRQPEQKQVAPVVSDLAYGGDALMDLIREYRKANNFKDSFYTDADITCMIQNEQFTMPEPLKKPEITNKSYPIKKPAANKHDKPKKDRPSKQNRDGDQAALSLSLRPPTPSEPLRGSLVPGLTQMCVNQNQCVKRGCKYAHCLREFKPLKCSRDLECRNIAGCKYIHSNETVKEFFLRTCAKSL